MLATYLSIMTISPLLFPTAIVLMAVSMSLFVVDIYLCDKSTGELQIYIGDVETLWEKRQALDTTSSVKNSISLVLAWNIVVLPFQHDIE